MVEKKVESMKNIAIIPARSGSKGVPHKNIKEINGLPLMAYTIRAAKESGLFHTVMVSTDSEQYGQIAKEHGADVPFLRSQTQSTDKADSWAVVEEVLRAYAERGETFDTVCLLQPTSPLRSAEDVIAGYNLLEEKQADAVTSVCEAEHSPLWCMTLDDDRCLDPFRASLKETGPRQGLSKFYRLNGAVYIRKIRYIDDAVQVIHSNEYALVMDAYRSVDIDTPLDFKMAEVLLGSQAKKEAANG